MDLLAETGQVHTHETYGTEVADAAFSLLIFTYRYAEAVPVHRLGIAVTEFDLDFALIGNIVSAYFKVTGTQRYAVLEELLILIHCVVTVGILDIRG